MLAKKGSAQIRQNRPQGFTMLSRTFWDGLEFGHFSMAGYPGWVF